MTGAAISLSAILLAGDPAAAQEAASPDVQPEPAPAPQGVFPVPVYHGDLWERSFLAGDPTGDRTSLAEQGVQFSIDWTQTAQSVVSGGRNSKTAYGGTLDYTMTLDLMKMNLLPGAAIKLRGESRYGESVNGDAGPLLPVSADMSFPLTKELDENVPFALTTLTFNQFFSESFGIFIGKFDTLDGDGNEFASGRGLTQFQNLNFVFNPAPLVTVPYSTLGAGLFWTPAERVAVSASIANTSDSSTTTGFSDIGDGWTLAAETSVQYRVGDLPGGFNVGGTFAWDNDFATIGRRFTFEPGEGITPVPGQDESWALYTSMWQYLSAEAPTENADAPLNVADGRPDRRGLGVFARLGLADDDTNPLELGFSGGLGGRGILPGRPDDIFGVGYFRNEVQTRRLTTVLGIQDSYEGFEAFYNIAVTPAVGLTFNVQVVEPARDVDDTGVVLGLRLMTRF
ncbi:MAG: carbohydrate porin [Phycisphaerales bacterium]